VTSLGIGGSNAHVVLEQSPAIASSGTPRGPQLLTLSAKSTTALDAATGNLLRHLERNPGLDLGDAAYTLHLGRSSFLHRRIVVCNNAKDALASLRNLDPHRVATGEASTKDLAVVFMFSGQGSQYVNMGRTLYASEPVFRKWIDACASEAGPILGLDIRSVMYPPDDLASTAVEQIRQTWITQPSLFAVEYALAQLWMSWGIQPARLLGHSIGEYVAACLAGVFSFEDAVKAVAARGMLMRELSCGAMLAVAQSETEIRPLLNEDLSLAVVNGPGQSVVSGSVGAIEALEQSLKATGVPATRLQTSHAFHSHLMDPILDRFSKMLRQMRLSAPRIPLLSNFTGTWLTADEATDPQYWAKHLRNTVRFHEGLDVLVADPNSVLLEVGPGETLASLAKRHPRHSPRQKVFSSLPASAQSAQDAEAMLLTLGHFWLIGAKVDWKGFHSHARQTLIPLPTYPFERRKFWMGPTNAAAPASDSSRPIHDWFYRVAWKRADAAATETGSGPWLIFCDSDGAGQNLADRLRVAGAEVITVFVGKKFQSTRAGSFSINPASEADFSSLINAIPEKQWPRKIVYLWTLEKTDSFRISQELAFYSLLFFLQHLGRRLGEEAIHVGVFTQGAVSVNGEPVLNPGQATVSGPCRVAPKEYANLICRQIDVDNVEPNFLARVATLELSANNPESVVAYRNNLRWTESVEHTSLESGPSRLRERGVYLVTGGLSGLGLATAKWLARACRARLVLVSRDAESRMARHETDIKDIERAGAEVLIRSANVTDVKAMRQVLEEAQQRFGRVQGVIHAAGLLDDGVIELKTQERAERVLAPKLDGTRVLNELLQDSPLDFFAMFSSVSALSPPAGQVDYCSANAYLNAFAASCPPDRNVIAIGWSAWGEVGMAVAGKESKTAFRPSHPLIESLEVDTDAQSTYAGTLSFERHWILNEHRVHGGDALLPGTGHLELAVTALWRKIGRQPVLLRDVLFLKPLLASASRVVDFRGELRREGSVYRFSTTSGAMLFASGEIGPGAGKAKTLDLKAIAQRCSRVETAPRNLRQDHHFDFGPRWRTIRTLAFGQDECLAELELPAEFSGETKEYSLHPALLDMATGIGLFLIPGYDAPGDICLPFSYREILVYGALPSRVFSHARIRRSVASDIAAFDITITDPEGAVVLEIEEFTIKRISNPAETLWCREGPQSRAPERAIMAPAKARPRIETRDGVEALGRILNSRTNGVIVVSMDNPSPIVEPATPSSSTKASAQTGLESALQEMWQQLLGVQNVDLNADFFQLGGHSLIATRLFSEIRKRFQVDLGLATLFETPTITALAARIRENRKQGSQEPVDSLRCVVPIRSEGSNLPFFCVHGYGGNVLNYQRLVRYFPLEQPAYGIQSHGLDGSLPDLAIEDMARRYIAEIRQVQPVGPYFVGGHSFGGLVAYEIGCQLEASGVAVGLIVLIDALQHQPTEEGFTVSFNNRVAQQYHHFMRRVRHFKSEPNRMAHLKGKAMSLLRKASRLRPGVFYKLRSKTQFDLPANVRYVVAANSQANLPVGTQNVVKANLLALDRYKPRSSHFPVALFRCTTRGIDDHTDYLLGWRNLVLGNFLVREIPGDHHTMMAEPNVKFLADNLSECVAIATGAAQPDAVLTTSTP
jgi:acyl transferase domain-containing protein/thioesterase domain-containing protein